MVHNLSKNEGPSPHMIWSPAAFLPHFLPVPALFTLPATLLPYFLNTPSTFLLKALVCGILSAWGTLFQLAMWLLSSVLQVTSPEKQSLIPHKPFMLTSPSLSIPLSCFIFSHIDYIPDMVYLYICFFIHLFPLTYHSMRTEIRFPLLYTST